MFLGKRNNNHDLRYIAFGYSIIGQKEIQQDAYLITEEINQRRLLAIADGVSNAYKGEYASNKAIEIFRNFFPSSASFDDPKDFLRKTAFLVASVLMNDAQKEPKLTNSATTLTSAYIIGNEFYTLNIGDSRVYQFSNNKLIQITKDHTLIQEMIDNQEITNEQAKQSNLKNILTSVLSPDFFKIKMDIKGPFKLQQRDMVLLTSDGVHDFVSIEELQRIIQKNKNIEKLPKIIVHTALKNKSNDNITAIVYKH